MKNSKDNNRILANHMIRASQVLCIDQDDNNIGVIPIKQAFDLANNVGLDLVQMSPGKDNTPVCKIVSFDKYRYDKMKKDKVREKASRQTIGKLKEIRLRPFIDTNDLKTKASKAKEFLDDGCNVRISVMLKGREMSHKDIVFEKLNNLIAMINEFKLDDNFEAAISNDPTLNNRMITAMISRKRISGEA